MKIIDTEFPGLKIIEPKIFPDGRGYFFESFRSDQLAEAGIDYNFVQDNESFSESGVLRGLHYQLPPYTQTKLIRALSGEILDVAADLRKNSPTFGRVFKIRLSGFNHLQLLIPRGFAHGFAVLSDTAAVAYKCDNYYAPAAGRGIIFSDSFLNIDWETDLSKAVFSAKDLKYPDFKSAEIPDSWE